MNIEFDDHRVNSPSEWDQLKARTAFNGLPLHESGTLSVSQSHAILRQLAHRFQWLGKCEENDTCLDITQEFLSEAQENLW
jgi:hypothetical protein